MMLNRLMSFLTKMKSPALKPNEGPVETAKKPVKPRKRVANVDSDGSQRRVRQLVEQNRLI